MDRSGIQSVEPKSHPDMHLRQQLRRVDESNDGIGVLLQYLISGKICFLCKRYGIAYCIICIHIVGKRNLRIGLRHSSLNHFILGNGFGVGKNTNTEIRICKDNVLQIPVFYTRSTGNF